MHCADKAIAQAKDTNVSDDFTVPPNYWHQLRGKSGRPFALRFCKGQDAFDTSAACHG
jgi:hypothetical protein